MPRRPSKIVLGPHTHNIKFVKKIDNEDPLDTESRRLGESHRSFNQILICTDAPPTVQASTLIHEALHMIFYDSGIDGTAGWNEEVEEFVIQTLESRLLELFTRNPKAVAWLAAGGEG